MPGGGGLRPVVQPVGADVSGYVAEYAKAARSAREFAAANREAMEAVRQLQALQGAIGTVPGGTGVAGDIRATNAAIRDGLSAARDYQAAMRAARDAAGDLSAAHASAVTQVAAVSAAIKDATAMSAEEERVVRAMAAAIDSASRASAAYRTELSAGSDQVSAFTDRVASLRESATATAAAVDDVSRSIDVLQARAAGAGPASVSVLGPSLAEAIASGGSGGGGGGSPWATTTSAATAAIIARNIARSGSRSSNTGDPAVVAALSALLGGGGGGGGGILGGAGGSGGYGFPAGGFFSGGGSDFLGQDAVGKLGSAAWYADNVTKWVKTSWPYIHYTVMAMAELAATVAPAAVALGSAGLVGLQGGQQMYTRFNAINSVEQSLGQAYGQTTGSFLGLQPKLQQLQNYAQGGVYEVAGAGINLVKSGVGSAFGQQGVQTIAMIDRGIADMQDNMAANGTGQQLGDIMAGGTGYLRQFGDIGSNLGNIVLGMAPHLPGVGADWISALEGATGGLAGGIGFLNKSHLGNVLGGMMAGEAGWRLGTPLVGLAGKGLTGLGGLASKAGLGSTGLTASEAEGLTGGDIADLAAMFPDLGIGAEATGLGAGVVGLGGEGLAGFLTGAGGAMGMLGGPEVAGLALSAFLGSKLISSMPSASQRQVSALQNQVDTSGFTNAWQPLGQAITKTTGLAALAPKGFAANMPTEETGFEYSRYGPLTSVFGPTNSQVYANAAQGFTQQMSNLVTSGPQLQKALDDMGLKGTSLSGAFQIAQNSLLDLSHAFDSHGKLNKQAMTMIGNYVSALTPMTQNAGALGAAIGAQTIMSQGSVKQLQGVNQSMDSMTSIMTGGPAGMASLFTLLGASPVTHKVGGESLQAPPAYAKFAQALTSFTSAGGSSAWSAFAGSQGLVTTEEQNLDQIRTALTLTQGLASPFTPGQAAGLAGFQLEQLLPMAKKSPAALAMVMQQAAQMGIGSNLPNGGYYDSGESLAKNYQQAQTAITSVADSTKKANTDTAGMTIKLSQIPAIAKTFSTTVGTKLQSDEAANAASALISIQKSAVSGGLDKGAITDWVAAAKSAGITGGTALKETMNSQLSSMGVPGKMTAKIDAVIDPASVAKSLASKPVTVPVKADTQGLDTSLKGSLSTSLKGTLGGLKGLLGASLGPMIDFKSKVEPPKVPAPPKGGTVDYTSRVQAPKAPPAPPGGTVIYHSLVLAPGGVAGTAAMIGGGNLRITTGQHGFRVPGTGTGDIFPALLEPGELVVPRSLVAAGAVDHLRGKIPGYAAGGYIGTTVSEGGFRQVVEQAIAPDMTAMAQSLASVLQSAVTPQRIPGGIAAGQSASAAQAAAMGAAFTPDMPILRSAVNKVLDSFEKTFASMGNPWGKFATQLLDGLLDSIKDPAAETKAMAQALVKQVTTEVQYGQSVASNTVQGLNLAGMTVPAPGAVQVPTSAAAPGSKGYSPATWNAYVAAYANDALPGGANYTAPAQSVQQQMKSYLGSIQSFSKDLAKLTKDHLSKGVEQQIISAGPVQGDALAQSILSGGQGSVNAVNKLWGQIGTASNSLGLSAAQDIYGPIKGATGKNVKVGATADLSGVHDLQNAIDGLKGKTVTVHVNVTTSSGSGVSLSTADIKQITQGVQAELLKQAQRNTKTGVQLKSKNP